jgi:hypothetical protein
VRIKSTRLDFELWPPNSNAYNLPTAALSRNEHQELVGLCLCCNFWKTETSNKSSHQTSPTLVIQAVFNSKHYSAPPTLSPLEKTWKTPASRHRISPPTPQTHTASRSSRPDHMPKRKRSATSTSFSFPETWLGYLHHDSFAHAAMTTWILRGWMRVTSMFHPISSHLTVFFVHSLKSCQPPNC